VASEAGSTTCGADHVTVFLQLSWPVGTKLDLNQAYQDAAAPRFVRDTTGSKLRTYGSSDLDVEVPASARPTGFSRQGNMISVEPDAMAAYVTRANHRTERWARLRAGEGCG
jgi:hypothetical protein